MFGIYGGNRLQKLQIQNVWSSLDVRRRIIVGLATGAVFAAILTMSRMAAEPSLTLLYSGLESGPAGEVVQALEQRGVVYEVRGGAIFVESAQRDELRMTLASQGLPTNSIRGYELLDSLTGFGTTSQMFDAAYWRAKEGELARTIVASPLILSARVHIANVGSNPFQRNVKPSASVSVRSANGGLPGTHAKALKYLISSAVTGLAPEDVSVIDGKGGLIGASEETNSGTASQDRANILRERVQNMLEARVGYGNSVVEVSVDTVNERETVNETRIDPNSRIAISTDTEERTNNSTESAGGDVTVASNLPDGDGAGGDNNSSQNSQTRERINYEVSETHREILRSPGAIRRLSVAVLVNGTSSVDGSGAQVFEPRSEDELSALRELVSSAVGFDEERGDVITIKSMEFEPIVPAGTASGPSLFSQLNLDVMSIIQIAVLGLVTLVLGLFVLRPLLSKAPATEFAALGAPSGRPQPAARQTENGVPEPITGEIDDGQFDPSGMAVISGGGNQTSGGGAVRVSPEDSALRLRSLIGERQEETVEILRSWLENREENA